MEYRHYWKKRKLRHFLSMPFIYGMIIPLIFLDVCLEIYHRVAFFLYKIDYVERRKYIKIDRQRLTYLTGIEKINCMYCGYANGLFHYASMIAAKTEHYWCGIKHSDSDKFHAPSHHNNFLPFDDKEKFKEYVKEDK